MEKSRVIHVTTLILSGIVVGIIGWILYQYRTDILSFPWRLDFRYLFLVLLFHAIALFITFIVWHLMIARLSGFEKPRSNFNFYYLSTLAKRLPSSLPYIGGRLALYKQVGVPGAVVLNCILLENILIGIAGVFIFILFLPFYSAVPEDIVLPLAVVAIGLLLVFFYKPQIIIEFTNWLIHKLRKGHGIEKIPERKDILVWVGLYTLPWLFAGASLYFTPRALSTLEVPNIMDALAISTLATLVTLVNLILPGGMGLREITASALLARWMPLSTALIISIIYRLLHTSNEVIWALGAMFLTSSEPEKSVFLEKSGK